MATVTLGNIKFNWKGAYNSSTAYVVDDVVSLSGSSYVCIQAGTNQNPASATAYWEQMSSAGTNGTDLTTTLTTQGDIVYRDGSGLARLGAGTSGQVLQTGGTGANPSWVDASVGISEADHWRLSADTAGGFNGVISSNLERTDNTGFDKIGTGMSVSSGVWTFPSTGIYLVRFLSSAYNSGASGNDPYMGITIDLTVDGGSNWITYASTGGRADTNYVTMVTEEFFDVTNTSNVKVRFQLESFNGASFTRGGTNTTHTGFTFIRLGDT